MAASILLFACQKEQPAVAQKEMLKTQTYVLDGQEYEVTWYENVKTGACRLDNGSAANQKVGEFMADHEQAVIVDLGSAEKRYLFSDIETFGVQQKSLFAKYGTQASAKTSGELVRVRFYEHAGLVGEMMAANQNVTATGAASMTDPTLISAVSTFVGENWLTSRVFWKSWVGTGDNDRLTSFEAKQESHIGRHVQWDHFVLAIYENLNYGGDVYFFVRGDMQLPASQMNLQTISMWGGFNNFNDETSSYWGSAFIAES